MQPLNSELMKPRLKLACNYAEEPLFRACKKTLHLPVFLKVQLASSGASHLTKGIFYLTEISNEHKAGQQQPEVVMLVYTTSPFRKLFSTFLLSNT